MKGNFFFLEAAAGSSQAVDTFRHMGCYADFGNFGSKIWKHLYKMLGAFTPWEYINGGKK